MRKLFLLIPMLLIFTGCYKTVAPGHVGILIQQTGSQRGVQDFPIQTGRVFYNPFNENVLEYPTFVHSAVWTANTAEGKPVNEEISFTTRDSMQVKADVSIAYQLQTDKVPYFYVKFRSDDLDQFTMGFLRNIAREKFDNAAGKYTIDQIMGDNSAFLAEARSMLQADLTPIGVQIQQLGFIGAPRPPESVIESINMKVKANQIALQKQTEVLQVEAEAKKAVAEAEGIANAQLIRADAEAKANAKVANSLTPTLVEWKKLDKWNGELPKVSGSGSGVIVDLRNGNK